MVQAEPSGLELLLFLAVAVAAGLLSLAWGLARAKNGGDGRSRWRRPLVPVLVGAGLAAAGLALARIGAPRIDLELLESTPEQLPTDGFASSKTCQACHPQEYHSWRRSYHSTMTQVATPESVVAPFDGVRLETRGRVFHLERRGDQLWAYLEPSTSPPPQGSVHLVPPGWNRIVMVTGSHHMQVFWIATPDGYFVHFPWEYFIDEKRWIPSVDAFLWPDQAEYDIPWEGCPACHTTHTQPRKHPDRRQKDHRVTELGIACESCHGPAAEHVRVNRSPWRRYRMHVGGGSDSSIVDPSDQTQRVSSQICGQCHSVFAFKDDEAFNRHGLFYRIGDDLDDHLTLLHSSAETSRGLNTPFWSDNTVRVGGREYTGMIQSACYTAGDITCLSCHSMHRSDPDHQLSAGMEGNEACFQCHATYRQTLAQHTRHPADSAGSLCYNCHMPYTSYALLGAVRSHRIDNPRVVTTPGTVRPNACSLCHLDKPLAWAAERMAEWYGAPVAPLADDEQQIAAGVLWTMRGDAAQRAIAAWHMGWGPAREASGEGWLAPFLATLLNDPYAAVRTISHRALRRLPGHDGLDYDPNGARERHLLAARLATDAWLRQSGAVDRTGPAVLIEPPRRLEADRLQRLLARRDDRPVGITE